MTVGALILIILGVIIILGGLIIGVMFCCDDAKESGIATIVVCLIIGATLIVGTTIYLNTESGKRAIKDTQSEFGGGIERTVSVYDVNGELIKTYEGKFDVEVGNSSGNPYIVFDDENNKRHIVYYTTGTILIDEK